MKNSVVSFWLGALSHGAMLAMLIPMLALAGGPETDRGKELDLRFKLNDTDRLYWSTSFSGQDSSALGIGSMTVQFVRQQSARWSWMAGLRVYTSPDPEPGSRTSEKRGILDLYYVRPINERWIFRNRNQLDLRWVNGDTFEYRVRERVELRRLAELFNRTVAWYGSYELFYNSDDTSGVSKFQQRTIFGLVTPFRRTTSLDLYLQETTNTLTGEESETTLGIKVIVSFPRRPEGELH